MYTDHPGETQKGGKSTSSTYSLPSSSGFINTTLSSHTPIASAEGSTSIGALEISRKEKHN